MNVCEPRAGERMVMHVACPRCTMLVQLTSGPLEPVQGEAGTFEADMRLVHTGARLHLGRCEAR